MEEAHLYGRPATGPTEARSTVVRGEQEAIILASRRHAPPRRTRSSSPAPRNDIDHRLTKPKHPWTDGQVGRMNRISKDATVRRYHYDATTSSGSTCATSSLPASAAGSRPCGLTPYEAICKAWADTPENFMADQHYQIPGPGI